MYFLIFFSIVLLIYGSANYYIILRGWQALEILPGVKPWYLVSCIVFASSYLIARFLQRFYPCILTDILTWVGSFWMAAMVYFLIAVLVIDLARLVLYFFPSYHLPSLPVYPVIKAGLLMCFSFIIIILIFIGFYNTLHTSVVPLDLTIHKQAGSRKEVKIIMVSDIHLGTIIGKNRVHRMVELINSYKPDLLLFAGDIVDEDLGPVIRQNLGQSLQNLYAPLGIWAITGNHEYIGGAEPAVKYLKDHGIRFLRDTAVLIDHSFWLAGREDRDISRFSGKKRKTVNEVISLTDRSLPLLLMDHQPFELDKAVEAGVDLQLSGHTHHGQFWPFNFITEAIYEISKGYRNKGNTHFYVSSGFGTWGPPVRLGSRSEIILITLHFATP
ncbi:MAG: metallophosphoesterase [Bacteroidetes bacterium]|nr:metallophosphoesterase [Bacteroidota bacterium]